MANQTPNSLLTAIDEQSPELYRVAMQTLRIGFLITAALFVVGFFAGEISDDEMSHAVMQIDEIPRALLDGEPMAFLDLAILILIFTPVVTVSRLALMFYRLGERRFAVVSFLVLAILLLSAVVALVR